MKGTEKNKEIEREREIESIRIESEKGAGAIA